MYTPGVRRWKKVENPCPNETEATLNEPLNVKSESHLTVHSNPGQNGAGMEQEWSRNGAGMEQEWEQEWNRNGAGMGAGMEQEWGGLGPSETGSGETGGQVLTKQKTK